MRLELRELDDTALVEAARSGDRQALDVLVAAALPLVYNVVGRALDGHHDADDVVQETLIRAVDRLGDLRDPAAFRSWLVAIAIRQVRDRWRKAQARPGGGADSALGSPGSHRMTGPHASDAPLDAADPGADFVDLTILRLELSDQRRETTLATRWLDPNDRELLALWWLEAAGQLSRADLAQALGLSAGHASVRVQRMRQQLENSRAVVRALAFTPRCLELDEAAKSWDGRPAPLWRKRFARHVRECVDCGGVIRGLVPADRLLAGLALVPVPAALAAGWAVRSAAAGSGGVHVVASRGLRGSRHAAGHAHRSGWFAGHVSAKVVAIGASLATVGAAGVVYATTTTGHGRSGNAAAVTRPSTAPASPAVAATTAARATPTPPPAPGLVPIGTIGLSAPLSYLTAGYNGMPEWTRVDTQSAPDGSVQVAWPAPDGVHVTPLTPAGRRRGPDVVVPGAREVGGLVAHDDGFALLTRVPDANKGGDTAAELVRYRDGARVFATRLTGSASDDTAPVLDGRLGWNGSRYGAYFVVRGAGGPADGHYGDKLTYISGTGAVLAGGWSWGCSHDEGLALYPEASGSFTSLCFDDWRSGLFVSTGIGAPDVAPVVQREQCWAGYCGGTYPGNAGTLVKSPSGRYATAFASRGAASAGKNPADSSGRGWSVTARTATHQVVVAFLKDGSTPAGAPVRLTDETGVDHVNVRIAPLGTDRLLVSWEDVAVTSCASGTCRGRFAGTRLRVVDWTGKALGPDQTVDARITGDVAALPDGSLVWAYTQATPDESGPLSTSPTTSTLSIVQYRP